MNEFASCAENIPGGQFDSPNPKKLWPRITQAIQLDAESALQIGLFDFDISATAAANTGANVLITLYSKNVKPEIYSRYIAELDLEKN